MNNLNKRIVNSFYQVGKMVFTIFSSIGEIVIFFLDCLKYLITDKFYPKILIQQLIKVGYNSLPVVGLTSIFTGMVLALQSGQRFSRGRLEFEPQLALALIGAWAKFPRPVLLCLNRLNGLLCC